MLPMPRLRAQTRNPEHAMWFPRSVSNSVVPFLRSEACKSASAPESVPWQSCELNDRLQVHLRSSTCLWSQLHWDLKSDMQPEQCTGKKNVWKTGCHYLGTNGFHSLLVSRSSWANENYLMIPRIHPDQDPKCSKTWRHFWQPIPVYKKGCPVIPLLATKEKSL